MSPRYPQNSWGGQRLSPRLPLPAGPSFPAVPTPPQGLLREDRPASREVGVGDTLCSLSACFSPTWEAGAGRQALGLG